MGIDPVASAVQRDRAYTKARRTLSEWRSHSHYVLRHRASRRQLTSLHNAFQGERCFIIGNGPSLNNTDMGLLQHEKTFGLNRVYLAFDRFGFSTTFLACTNRYVFEQSAAEMAAVSSAKFFSVAHYSSVPRDARDVTYFRPTPNPGFSIDPIQRGLWEGATVTFVALQLAYWLGFRQAVLVGVDHNFTSNGPAHQLVTSSGPDANHFDPSYFGSGYRWQLPDLETSEIAYAMARDAYARDGREVIDATVGGKLEVFPKRRLETLF